MEILEFITVDGLDSPHKIHFWVIHSSERGNGSFDMHFSLSSNCVCGLLFMKRETNTLSVSGSPKALDRVNHAFLFTQFILVARRLVDPFPCPKRASWYSFLSERIALLYFPTILLHFC